MDGNANIEKLSAFIARIRGEPVTRHQELTLRSVERAALSSWVRREGVVVRPDCLSSSAPFSLEQLLSAGGIEEPSPRPKPELVQSASAGQVGIDMEEVDNLPPAHDYREHPFYADHFTSAEIAYCICQPDVRASFCGIWAAKEAVMKAGLVATSMASLNAIEIAHDGVGRPVFPNCSISISHTPRAAVAICAVV